MGPHVNASVTVTFFAPKRALVLLPAGEAAGAVWSAPLGVPERGLESVAETLRLVTSADLTLPTRPRESHKGTFGHLVIVAGSLDVAAAIILESTLSFLGLGFPPDIPTWGRILFDAKDNLDFAPHWAIFPGTAIFLTVLAINFIGDGLRDALDPRKVL